MKVSSYLTLDKYNSKAGLPRSRLYKGVQKFMDRLIDQVEDRSLGLDSTDTHVLNVQSSFEILVRYFGSNETAVFSYVL